MVSFSAVKGKNTRWQGIDGLRGLAVLLVMCRHWNTADFLTNMGWAGVDLFFVISGFLVSGLLFRERQRSGGTDLLRFFVRRGLKIYPLFLALIVLTALAYFTSGRQIHYRLFAQELIFLQNYLGGIYLHTWSLAVEEHFYLLLILCFGMFHKKHLQLIPWICVFFMVAAPALRFALCAAGNCNNHFFTHTRIDSLFTGVLLSYCWHYHKQVLLRIAGSVQIVLAVLAVFTFAIFSFAAPASFFTQTFGFTLLALASAVLILAVLLNKNAPPAWPPLAFTGFYSYAIYLVHIPVKLIFAHFGIEERADASNTLYFLCYLACSVAGGILVSELVEQPVLRMRDRRFPSKV